MNLFIKFLSGLIAFNFIILVWSFDLKLGFFYYGLIFISIVLLILKFGKVHFNLFMSWIVVAGFFSILLNEIPIFFRPIERFFSFILVVSLIGPFIRNSALERFRFDLFNTINFLIVALVIFSFVGISIGLPTMVGRGGFAGLFNHSMMLGPMSAISILICLSWAHSSISVKRRWLFFAFASFSFITCVAAGSRSALLAGVAGVLFYYFKINQGKLTRFVRIIFFVLFIVITSFPLWESYTERIIGKMAYSADQGDLLYTREALWTISILEFKKSPIYGVGFASVDTSINDKFNEEGGTIEPGSSWLVVLSMLGLLGSFPMFFLLFSYLKFLFYDKVWIVNSSFLGGLLVLMVVHMMAEGYVFSAGSGLFFIFWLIMGLIEQMKNFKNVITS